MNNLPTTQKNIIKEAIKILKTNTTLSENQKNDVLTLLKNNDGAKIKVAEAIMEGRNLIMNSRDHTAWTQNLLMFCKHVYGDAPVKTENLNLEIKMDMSDAIKEAYKKRMEEETINITPTKEN